MAVSPVVTEVPVHWLKLAVSKPSSNRCPAGGFWVKVAVTVLALFMLMEVGFVLPVRSPLQPLKLQPETGLAVRVTIVPEAYVAWSGFLVTDPEPTMFTVKAYWSGGSCVKVAVTALLPFIVIVVGLVLPDKSPLHPLNVQPEAGLAVKVTTVPGVYVA